MHVCLVLSLTVQLSNRQWTRRHRLTNVQSMTLDQGAMLAVNSRLHEFKNFSRLRYEVYLIITTCIKVPRNLVRFNVSDVRPLLLFLFYLLWCV